MIILPFRSAKRVVYVVRADYLQKVWVVLKRCIETGTTTAKRHLSCKNLNMNADVKEPEGLNIAKAKKKA